jgi:hypothetical protein
MQVRRQGFLQVISRAIQTPELRHQGRWKRIASFIYPNGFKWLSGHEALVDGVDLHLVKGGEPERHARYAIRRATGVELLDVNNGSLDYLEARLRRNQDA